jgi:large subunit ribosomal protein L18
MTKKLLRLRRAQKTKHIIKKNASPSIIVSRTLNHIYAQLKIADARGDITVACASTLDKEIMSKKVNKTEKAKLVGQLLAKRAIERGYTDKLAFDRNGFHYHGRVKALAAGAREAGLEF